MTAILLAAFAFAGQEPLILPDGHRLLGFDEDGTMWFRGPDGVRADHETETVSGWRFLADGRGPAARIENGGLVYLNTEEGWSQHPLDILPGGLARAADDGVWAWSNEQLVHVSATAQPTTRTAPCPIRGIGGTRGDDVLVHCNKDSHWVSADGHRPFAEHRTVLSPDGQLALRGGKEPAWVDLDTGDTTPTGATGLSVMWAPDSGRAMLHDHGGNATIWDRSRDEWTPLALEYPLDQPRFTVDGRHILSGSGRWIDTYDTSTGRLLTPTPGHRGRMRLVAVSPGQDAVLTTDASGARWLWTHGGEPVRLSRWKTAPGGPGRRQSDTEHGQFTPDGRTVISAARSGHVDLRDGRTGKLRAELPIDTDLDELGPHIALEVAPKDGGEFRRCGNGPREIPLPPLSDDGKVLATLGGTRGERDGRRLPSDPLIHFWEVPSGKLLRTVVADEAVEMHGFDADGRLRIRAGASHFLIGVDGDPEVVSPEGWPQVARVEDLEWEATKRWGDDEVRRTWEGFTAVGGTIEFR